MKFKAFKSALCAVLMSSCVSLQTVSLTQIPVEKSKPVSATVSKFIILGFNFNNDYVDELTAKLREQCPDGHVRGILTKDEATFYVFAHTRSVTAKGYCVK